MSSSSNKPVCFQWIEPCSERLFAAQKVLLQSVYDLGLKPLLFRSGKDLVSFKDILQYARSNCDHSSFVWCNSDVVLKRDPFEVDDGVRVQGFHRTEIPSGNICGGVDMYLIPCRVWDNWLKDDAPTMRCGATHIDWWLTNTCSLRRCYESHSGFIDHVSHEPSGASKSSKNNDYQFNIRSYNKWAKKNGIMDFKQTIHLPFIGNTMAPLTDMKQFLARSCSVTS